MKRNLKKFLVVLAALALSVSSMFADELKDWKNMVKAVKSGDKTTVENYLKNGVSANVKNKNGWTPLMTAAYNNKVDIANLLIQNGANVNLSLTGNYAGTTALMLAAEQGHAEMAKLLINSGASVNARTSTHEGGGRTVLTSACGGGNIEIVKAVTSKLNSSTIVSDVNARQGNGLTGLIWTCDKPSLDVPKYLLENGANVNARGGFNNLTPVEVAKRHRYTELANYLENYKKNVDALLEAVKKGDKATVEKLLNDGVNPNAMDENYHTALMFATEGGYDEIVDLLLKRGADPNLTDLRGNSADLNKKKGKAEYTDEDLLKAVRNNNKTEAEKILNNGIKTEYRDADGNTPLILAAKNNNKDLVELLLKNGANVNAQNYKGVTALMYATQNQNQEIVDLLLKYGADPNLKDKEGRVAADYAPKQESKPQPEPQIPTYSDAEFIEVVKSGDVNKVKTMLQGIVNIDAIDGDKNTGLIWASKAGNTEMVKLLIENKAKVNERNNDGYTAFMCAAQGLYKDTLDVLFKKGGAYIFETNSLGQAALKLASGIKDKAKAAQKKEIVVAIKGYIKTVKLFHKVAKKGDKGSVENMLKNGEVHVNVQNIQKQTALRIVNTANKKGKLDAMVQFLKENGATE